MKVVGKVESVWRYPVKSMAGEELEEAFVGFSGVFGDRLYAIHSSAARKEFPFFTAREQEQMLLYRPRYRHADRMLMPSNVAEVNDASPGMTPLPAALTDSLVDVETPAGEVFAIDDPRLLDQLKAGAKDRHEPALVRSDRAMTDCRPVSLFSVQTVRQLGRELGSDLDKRQFRANVYLDLGTEDGFGEDQFVKQRLRLGANTVIAVTDRDPRCKMITLNPDTAEANPQVMRLVAETHEGQAGVYGAVVTEGIIRRGDEVTLLD